MKIKRSVRTRKNEDRATAHLVTSRQWLDIDGQKGSDNQMVIATFKLPDGKIIKKTVADVDHILEYWDDYTLDRYLRDALCRVNKWEKRVACELLVPVYIRQYLTLAINNIVLRRYILKLRSGKITVSQKEKAEL